MECGREEGATELGGESRFVGGVRGAVGVGVGKSLITQNPVAGMIGTRFLDTLKLATYAAVIAVPVAILLGVLVALFRNSIFDRVANVLTLMSISSPEFFLGYILILFLAVKTGYFPAIATLSYDLTLAEWLHCTFLPSLTMVLLGVAHVMRIHRTALTDLRACLDR